MANYLFVGNLPFAWDDARLSRVFAEAGNVTSAKVIKDKYSGRSRGFGFVEMASFDEANKALDLINGREIDGRKLVVNQSRIPKPEQ